MNKPTKKQLENRLNHFENAVKSLVNDLAAVPENDIYQRLCLVVDQAPSIDPVSTVSTDDAQEVQ